MANILSLAMKISADASGVVKNLTPAERALEKLGAEASKTTAVFNEFAKDSAAAAAAQGNLNAKFSELSKQLAGGLDPKKYAEGYAQLQDEVRRTADAFKEGLAITEASRTADERRAESLAKLQGLLELGAISEETYARAVYAGSEAQQASLAAEMDRQSLLQEGKRIAESVATADEKRAVELERLSSLLDAGAISQETFSRASMEASGANDAALAAAKVQADAEKVRADATTRAAAIVEANLTKEQRAQRDYSVATRELNALRNQGLLTEREYSTALQRVSTDYAKATLAADKFGRESGKGGDAGVLKFNELSGVLSALPGPIGNVAGRLSGLSSAGEGLARVFSGGLSQGIASIGTSVVGLINPFTAALAGVAAFAAGAAAVARGLVDLEDRVERLGNTADKLGVSFEFIQTLEAAAARSGTSVEAVSAAFGRLQKNVTGVDEESKAAQAALASIGVTAEELSALKPEEQYKLIGESIQAIEDPAKRTAASMGLFGKSGADLLPFFKNLGGAASDMERFGRALTDIDRQRIDDFGAGLDALGVATQGLGQSVLLPFAGLGEGVTTAFAEIIAGITAVVDPIGQVLEPTLSQIGLVIELIGTNLGNLGRVIGAVFDPFAVVVQGVSQAFEPLLDGVLDFFKAVSDSAVVITEWAMSFTPIGAIADNVGVLGDTISRVITIVTTAFSKVGEVIAGTFGGVSETVSSTVSSFAEFTGLGAALQAIGNVISGVFGSVASIFSTIANAIGGTVGRLLTMAENFLGIERAAETATAGIDGTAESVKELIEKASEFGQAGFDAAYAFQQALKELEDQAKDGELNTEQYARGVANATAEYDKQVESLKQVQEETKRAANEVQKRLDADRQVSDQLLEQARINREFGGDSNRAKAAEQVLAVEREIARVKEEVAAARDGGDAQAIANGEERLRQLGVIRNEQQAVADGSAKAAEDERKRLDDQRQRVDEMLASGQQQTQLEKDILDVQQQQLQAQADIVAARLAGNQQEADSATARLAQLDQLDAKLQGQQQALEQGFGQGFDAAFNAVNQNIDGLIAKSQQFGQAGSDAALRLQEGVAAAQQQARDGILLDQEAFNGRVEREKQLYEQELANIQNLANERKVINEYVDQELALQEFGGDQERLAASERVLAIEQEIVRVQKELNEARDAGNKKDIDAASGRLGDLEQVKAKEEDVASGRGKYEEDIRKQQEAAIKEYQQQQQQAQKAYAQEQARQQEEQRKAAEAEAKRQEDRLRKLNTLGQTSVQTADIRTQEGAALVLNLANAAQDPAAIQARLQTKLLEKIATGIGQAASNYFNQPVAIVGYSQVGGIN